MLTTTRAAYLCALFTTTALVPHAQADTAPSKLDTVTVTATRTAQDTLDVPAMVSVITLDDAGLAGASDTIDLFRDQPWLAVAGSDRRNGQTLNLRGYDQDGIIVLLDGTRQSFESAHDGRLFIDPALIDRIEVVRGIHAALYGSGGLGGVVSFKTKDAADLLAPGQTFGAMMGAGLATGRDEASGAATVYGRHGRWDGLGSVSLRHSGDIELGNGDALSAQDEVISGLFKLGFAPAAHHRLDLSVQTYQGDGREPNNPQVGHDDPISSQLADKTIRSTTARLGYRYGDPGNRLWNLTAQVYTTQTEVEERLLVTISPNLAGDVLIRQMDTWGLTLGNQSRFSSGAASHTLSYGLDYYRDDQNGGDSRFGERGGVPDAEANYLGFYLQDEIIWALGSAGDLMIIPAVRYDQYDSENAAGISNSDEALSPKLAVTYLPNDWLRLFANYGHAFRAPNMGEIYTTGTHFVIPGPGGGSNVFVPNPDLRAETARTFEVGFAVDWPGLAADQRLNIKGSYFETRAEDYIDTAVTFVPFPCCGTTTSVNVDTAEISGVELETGFETTRLLARLGYSHLTGRNSDSGDYLTNITPDTVVGNLAWKLNAWDALVGWRVTAAAAHDEVNEPEDARSGYVVHDIYAQWQPKGRPGLNLTFGVDNLFDKSYSRVFADAVSEGRSIKAGLRFAW